MEPLLTDLASLKNENDSRANLTQKWLKSKFGRQFLDKTKWPPRSPDLNLCDFFLWGYLKERVLNPMQKTLEDLKENITREMKKNPKILKEILKSSFLNFVKKKKFCFKFRMYWILNKNTCILYSLNYLLNSL